MTELGDDMWFEILINTDPHDFPTICRANKQVHKTCNNKRLWQEKFNNDGLPLVTSQKTVGGWIKEYDYTQKVMKETADIKDKLVKNYYPEDWGIGLHNYTHIDIFEDIKGIDYTFLKRTIDRLEADIGYGQIKLYFGNKKMAR